MAAFSPVNVYHILFTPDSIDEQGPIKAPREPDIGSGEVSTMLGALRETAVRLLPRSTVEYVYVTDIIKHYPLGFHTRDEAVVASVNLYSQKHFPPDTDSLRHAFGVHRADCERVDTMPGNSIECDADKPDGYCWEGVVEAHR